MTERKKLIEVALPLEAINEASAREKSIRHGHPSTLHLWWARRPLAACRAVIFTSLVDDPDHPNALEEFVEACKKLPKGKNAIENDTPRQRLFDFIDRLVTWEATTDEEILEKARELIRLCTDGNPPALLDPFAGGGSIPLEAQRLGLEAHASDLNPVAVMINKAMIEIPPMFKDMPPVNPKDRGKIGSVTRWKGADGLAADVRYYGEWMKKEAWEKIGHLYPKCNGETVIAYLWARTVKCPNPACGAIMPLTSSFWLSKKKRHISWVKPITDHKNKSIVFEVQMDKGSPPKPPKVGRGAKFRCLVCGEIAPDSHIKEQGINNEMGSQLMTIVTEGDQSRNYISPSNFDKSILDEIELSRLPKGELADDTRAIWCKLYGLIDISDLFTDRQLKTLQTFSELIKEVKDLVFNDIKKAGIFGNDISLRDRGNGALAYSEAISVYLSIFIDQLSNFQSTICTWNASNESMRATFSRQGLPMAWDYAESNPFCDSSGSFSNLFDRFLKVFSVFPANKMGFVIQSDSTKIKSDKSIPISTDPPYYDNIGYADLSDYFYVWLRSNIKSIYPDLFGTLLVPKIPELIASPYRFSGDIQQAQNHFEVGLRNTFQKIRNIVPDNFPISIYYAFKQEEVVIGEGIASTGWETMLNSLIRSNFIIVGTWPMRTERSGRMVSIGANSLASSIVLVCKTKTGQPLVGVRREFIKELRKSIPPALREMQSGSIAPVDLAQASIGPGMAVYSRYEKILEPDGSTLTVRTALQLINHVLDEYLAEQEGEMDQASRFAVAWFEQFGFDEGPFGQADVLARAKNTSVEGMVNSGILEAQAGKVRLLRWDELDPGQALRDGMVWPTTHLLIERLNTYGEGGVAELLASLSPDLAADARQLAYRLYSISDRKGWSTLARNYNALVISWNESQAQAQDLRKETERQGRLFGEQ